ncbi:MAG TPA: dihydrofolate reductase family protein [Caulobacteraceae bacterium]|nr:dihydrofolate reductase family protein [Caulobacteraceae bacterium]
MSKLVVRAYSISLDGYGAGPDQSLEHPLGVGGHAVHDWLFDTRTFRQMIGQDGGRTDVDDRYAATGFDNIGANIMGRNMFGPVRGPWPNDDWKGWWGENPPYHSPTFVLTHYPRAPIEMEGGTTFHFVPDGIESALQQAKAAAGDKDIRLNGGASTVQQYLRARLVDELHLVVSPVFLGSGENLYTGIDLKALGYVCTKHESTEKATHLTVVRKGRP